MSADNCFPALANPALAQRLMDEQLETDWPAALTMLAREKAHGNFTGKLTTSFKNRPEGVRVKHWAHGNSVKTSAAPWTDPPRGGFVTSDRGHGGAFVIHHDRGAARPERSAPARRRRTRKRSAWAYPRP
jgi:hypothetical protein